MVEITTSLQSIRKSGIKLMVGEQYHITVQPPVAQWLEFDNAFFRFNSSALLPEGQNPGGTGLPALSSGMGIVTRCLQHLSTTKKKVLVIGHADTVGSDVENIALSDHRAACVWAALSGDRELFMVRANGPHLSSKDKKTEVQLKDRCQILDWVSMEFGWPCSLSANYNDYFTAVARFQQAYNENDHAGNPLAEDLVVDKDWGEKVWGAVFDCYEANLARNLRITRDELSALRSRIQLETRLVRTDPQWSACGEYHPVDRPGQNNNASQVNRRVEVYFFDPGEEPELPCIGGTCAGRQCAFLKGGGYQMVGLPIAAWQNPHHPAGHYDQRNMMVYMPGLIAGEEVTFTVTQIVDGVETEVLTQTVTAQQDFAETVFYELSDEIVAKLECPLKPGQTFISYSYYFTATARSISGSSSRLPFHGEPVYMT